MVSGVPRSHASYHMCVQWLHINNFMPGNQGGNQGSSHLKGEGKILFTHV